MGAKQKRRLDRLQRLLGYANAALERQNQIAQEEYAKSKQASALAIQRGETIARLESTINTLRLQLSDLKRRTVAAVECVPDDQEPDNLTYTLTISRRELRNSTHPEGVLRREFDRVGQQCLVKFIRTYLATKLDGAQ